LVCSAEPLPALAIDSEEPSIWQNIGLKKTIINLLAVQKKELQEILDFTSLLFLFIQVMT
jgi:hypothetical protein